MGSRFGQKNFQQCRRLLPQELQQGIPRDTDLSSNADASYLPAADQLIGGIAPDAENRHQLLHPQRHGQVMNVVEAILHSSKSFFSISDRLLNSYLNVFRDLR